MTHGSSLGATTRSFFVSAPDARSAAHARRDAHQRALAAPAAPSRGRSRGLHLHHDSPVPPPPPPPSAYCPVARSSSSGSASAAPSIAGVSRISNNNGGYADFTSLRRSLARGSAPSLSRPGFGSSIYTEHWKVWVDLNQQLSVRQQRVTVLRCEQLGAEWPIVVPPAALTGNTRMRVQMKYGSSSTRAKLPVRRGRGLSRQYRALMEIHQKVARLNKLAQLPRHGFESTSCCACGSGNFIPCDRGRACRGVAGL